VLISDATNLRMLKSCGAVPVRHDAGEFWAIFDNGYLGIAAADIDVEERGPRLTCRTSDVQSLRKDAALDVCNATYRLLRHEPDGTGMSTLILKE
jgi:hypothetical protein